MNEVQTAGMWKRISAALLDLVLLFALAIGVAWFLSWALGYDANVQKLEGTIQSYEQTYGVDYDITQEAFDALTDAERAKYDEASQALSQDAEANRLYSLLFSHTLLIVTFGLLIPTVLLEFIAPLLFKDGRTIGKKIFGLAVMRENRVRITPTLLFIRAILGKYTIELMVPVLAIFMMIFLGMGLVGVIILGGLTVLQIVFLCSSPMRPVIHDKLSGTVAVDYASQKIFDTYEDLLEYQKRIHAEEVRNDQSA